MKASEFKAWFEGFSEGVGEAPTPEQWEKLRKKVSQVEDTEVINNLLNHRRPDRWYEEDLWPRRSLSEDHGGLLEKSPYCVDTGNMDPTQAKLCVENVRNLFEQGRTEARA